MSTVDEADGALWVNAKGAPESLLPRCTAIAAGEGSRLVDEADPPRSPRDGPTASPTRAAGAGRRATPPRPARFRSGATEAENDLTLLGLVAMIDPPRPEVADAVAPLPQAGIRIIVVTGDHGRTAAAIARQVGIAGGRRAVDHRRASWSA